MDLLTKSTHKIDLSKKAGYWEAVLYLSPADESGQINTCPNAGACKHVCLGKTSGLMVTSTSRAARIRRTLHYLYQRESFMEQIKQEIRAHVKRCRKAKMTPAFRFNGSSDLRGPAREIAKWAAVELPQLRCYDYTKIDPTREEHLPNYHLTYSYSERPEALTIALKYLSQGGNVAAVFSTTKKQRLPKEWHGFRVIDGDKNDARFADPKGVIIGLRAKGAARKPGNPFIVIDQKSNQKAKGATA